MTDIVERLRADGYDFVDFEEAAAEIERLRAALDIHWNGAIAAARNDALEDAATVAEYHSYTYDIVGQACSRNIAAAVRALKGKADD